MNKINDLSDRLPVQLTAKQNPLDSLSVEYDV